MRGVSVNGSTALLSGAVRCDGTSVTIFSVSTTSSGGAEASTDAEVDEAGR